MATYAGRYDEPMLRRVNGRLGVATDIEVRVYESDGTTVATLYTSRTKAVAAANPVAVDASGNLEFFADPGTYVLSILESDAQVATNVVTVHTDPGEPVVVEAHDHATNLTWTAATSTVASDTGTDAVLTAVDGSNPGLMSVAQSTKLAGIETGATTDQTAAELLTAIKTVDGSGSGLDADLLDGLNSTAFALASDLGAYQPLDADLTAIGGLSPSNDDIVQRKAGAWTNRTPAQVKTDLALAKGDVGLGNVDNTSDANKPVSTAQQTALDAKVAKATFPVVIGVALSDETTALTTGTAKLTIRAPFAFTLTGVRATLKTSSSSGIPTVDINEGGTTVLSTNLTIDQGELTSTTAATPAVISDSVIADDAEITFDIDVAGTGAAGLKVWLLGTRSL